LTLVVRINLNQEFGSLLVPSCANACLEWIDARSIRTGSCSGCTSSRLLMQENELVHAKSRKLRCTDASLNETMYDAKRWNQRT
jgi:hypothetical protein